MAVKPLMDLVKVSPVTIKGPPGDRLQHSRGLVKCQGLRFKSSSRKVFGPLQVVSQWKCHVMEFLKQELTNLCRRDKTLVAYHFTDCEIGGVPDPGDHGQWKGRNRSGELVIIIAAQSDVSAPTTNDKDGIKKI